MNLIFSLMIVTLAFVQPKVPNTLHEFQSLSRSSILRVKEQELDRTLDRWALIPRNKLASWSKSILRFNHGRQIQQLADNFTLAALGVDAGEHLNSLYKAYEYQSKLWSKGVELGKPYKAQVESLPFLFAKVFERTQNPNAVKLLWKMRLDGASSETQAYYLFRCLKQNPNAVLSALDLKGDRRALGLVDELQSDSSSANLKRTISMLAKKSGPAKRSAKALLELIAHSVDKS
jgi:hypothetical protein